MCSTISMGHQNQKHICCGGFDEKCVVYEVMKDKEGKLTFKALASFLADESNDCPTVNCTAVGQDRIVTGGQDGTCRVWRVEHTSDGWTNRSSALFKEHKGPIMQLALHPLNSNWICSASRDGCCILWNYCSDKPNALAILNGTETLQQMHPKSKGVKYECRGCVFSANGCEVVALMCPRKGAAFLVRWRLEVITPRAPKDALSIHPKLLQYTEVSPVPCTKLRVSPCCQWIAVGSSDGNLYAYHVQEGRLRLVRIVRGLHDLPITGLTVLPGQSLEDVHIVTCSADNKLNVVHVSSKSMWKEWKDHASLLLTILLIFLWIFLEIQYPEISHACLRILWALWEGYNDGREL